MSVTSLDTPFLEGGLHATYYFNGRILSREDLQRDRDAERALHARLAAALGAGVVRGFAVAAREIGGASVATPVVTVQPGLALDRCGDTIALDRPVDVSLRKPTAVQASGSSLSGAFADCAPPEDTVYVAGSGVYLLSVAPAQVKQGLTQVSGLGNGTATCNVKEIVHGVQFRLRQVTALTPAELADEVRLRNLVAYRFFFAAGIDPAGTARDPFGAAPPAPSLTDTPLADCEVPLATLQWTTTGGLRWVDLWSVRRRAAPAAAPLLPGAPDPVVGEAMLLQFAEQVRELWAAGGLAAPAAEAFRWLPPAGLLPVAAVEPLLSSTPPPFFGEGFTTRGPLHMEGADAAPLLRLATSYPPIQVGQPELVWLYLVRENRQSAASQPYVIFAGGRLPCQVVPRFDVSRWEYANFALE